MIQLNAAAAPGDCVPGTSEKGGLESGTAPFRQWIEQQNRWSVESTRLKQNPTTALVFDELRDDLNDYDKLETKKRDLQAEQLKSKEAFENGYKTLIASCVATTIAGLVYGYSRSRANEPGAVTL